MIRGRDGWRARGHRRRWSERHDRPTVSVDRTRLTAREQPIGPGRASTGAFSCPCGQGPRAGTLYRTPERPGSASSRGFAEPCAAVDRTHWIQDARVHHWWWWRESRTTGSGFLNLPDWFLPWSLRSRQSAFRRKDKGRQRPDNSNERSFGGWLTGRGRGSKDVHGGPTPPFVARFPRPLGGLDRARRPIHESAPLRAHEPELVGWRGVHHLEVHSGKMNRVVPDQPRVVHLASPIDARGTGDPPRLILVNEWMTWSVPSTQSPLGLEQRLEFRPRRADRPLVPTGGSG